MDNVENVSLTKNNIPWYIQVLPGLFQWSKRHYREIVVIFAFIVLGNFAVKGAFGFEPIVSLYNYTIGKTPATNELNKTAPDKEGILAKEVPTEADWLKGKYIGEWKWEGKNQMQRDNVEITKITPVPNKPDTFSVEGIGSNNSVSNYQIFGYYQKGVLYLGYICGGVDKSLTDGLPHTYAGVVYLEANPNANTLIGYWRGAYQDKDGAKKPQGWTVKLMKQ